MSKKKLVSAHPLPKICQQYAEHYTARKQKWHSPEVLKKKLCYTMCLVKALKGAEVVGQNN